MAFGEILKNARVQRGLTPSDVAENTHMMVQVVEDLEREDFRRIAAPIYGRGFVKLYAELLELDPAPLISDFMDLYSGSRAPAVRTKKVESQAEPVPEPAPVTRTVSGPAPLSPQRQPVQPRPAVRPLSTPPPDSAEDEPLPARGPVAVSVVESEPPAPRAETADEPLEPLPQEQGAAAKGGLVVEPETDFAESDEPDLFRPQPPRRKSAPAVESEAGEEAEDEPRASRRPKLPIFKIGGRMEEPRELSPQDEAAHARRRAKIQAFVSGVTRLKEGVESRLPSALPRKQFMILGGVGAAALVVMAVGIHQLFKMTGGNVKEAPNAIVKNVSPPPDLYVD